MWIFFPNLPSKCASAFMYNSLYSEVPSLEQRTVKIVNMDGHWALQ